ncbi:MAG TPA: MFS transporter, partial [Rugosimonospora sp.]|nr:MFS transporter [Rugosimonospora sp.]
MPHDIPRSELTQAPAELARFPGRDFRTLWVAVFVSQIGSAVTLVAVPLIAVVVLHATPGQMSLVAAADMVPSFLARVPVAAWSDRVLRRVPTMVACNLAQATAIGLVPLLWWRGALTLPALLAVVACSSLLLGAYGSLASPVVVTLVPPEHLVTANGRMSATHSVADVGGAGLAGLLLAALAAPVVVLVDAVSFVVSALLLT